MADSLNPHQKVWELIKDIRIALLVTHDSDGRMHARPMAAIQKDYIGELWFFTSIHSPKIAEIKNDANVLLCYAEPKSQEYVSLTGRAQVVQDKNKIKELWSEPVRTWFPKGVEDPEITLLKVTVEAAEYWDAPSAALVHIYGYAKARLTGERPNIGENKKVAF